MFFCKSILAVSLITFLFSQNQIIDDELLIPQYFNSQKKTPFVLPGNSSFLSIKSNNNPVFISSAKDTAYEDKPYIFLVLTNDLDADDATISSSSTPSWLTFAPIAGGKVETLTKPWYVVPPNNVYVKQVPLVVNDMIFSSDGEAYLSSKELHSILKVDLNGSLTIVAGTGRGDRSSDGSLAVTSPITSPGGIAIHPDGSIVFTESLDHLVRKIENGNIVTIVGDYSSSDTKGFSGDGGAATSAKLNNPTRISYDSSGNLYIVDQGNHRIRKVDTNGIITTVAGNGESGFGGDGGLAINAKFNGLREVVVDNNGNMFISDKNNHRIRKVDTDGIITTFAGTGGAGNSGNGGPAVNAEITSPEDLLLDSSGNLYFANDGQKVKKVDSNGIITDIAGSGISIAEDGASALSGTFFINGLSIFNNNLYLLDSYDYTVHTLDLSTGLLGYFGGKSIHKKDNVSEKEAFLNFPYSVKIHENGDIYFIERGSYKIRKISEGVVSTFAGNGESGFGGDGGLAVDAQIGRPIDMVWDSKGNMYFSDPSAHVIRKVDLKGIITTIAGTQECSYSNDGGYAIDAALCGPGRLAMDKNDNLYIAEISNKIIRVIDKNGIINTIAGKVGEANTSGDGNLAKDATFKYPAGLAFDSLGNLYVSDRDDCVIRKIDTNGNISTIAGTSGNCGDSGEGGPATNAIISGIFYMVFDRSDNLILADYSNDKIKKIMANGNILTIAGTGPGLTDVESYKQETARKSASIKGPLGIDVGDQGDIYFSDYRSGSIRVVNSSYGFLYGTPSKDDVGTSALTFTANDGQGGNVNQNFDLEIIAVNDSPILSKIDDLKIDEDSPASVNLVATDEEGDNITFSVKSNISNITPTISSNILTLTPELNWNGSATIDVFASDGYLQDTTSFILDVNPVNDAPVIGEILNLSMNEDETKSIELNATDVDNNSFVYSSLSDTNAINTSIAINNLTLAPNVNWNGVANISVIVSDGALFDTTVFKLTVAPVQDSPKPFEWISSATDTIDITKTNFQDSYNLKWSESVDLDNDSIDYLVSAKIGSYPKEEIYDTTVTTLPIPYQEFLDNVFEVTPGPTATVRFSVKATDGIDTVNVTGEDRVVYVNRYDYLSTDDIAAPTDFALHDNYPNPFNPTTQIRFDMPIMGDVRLTIYNMIGQKVKEYQMNGLSAGYHTLTWNATNNLGDPVSAGIYFYQLQTKTFTKTKRMVLLK